MLILVIGGSGSGKSEIAENIAVGFGGKRTYIAAMEPFGEEAKARIERHRAARCGKGFETVERYTDVEGLNISGTALLECLSNLLANEMFSAGGAGEKAVDAVLGGIEHLKRTCDNLVIVTNEIFSGDTKYLGDTKKYMKNLGYINCRIAERADAVYEVTCGIAERIK